MGKSQDAVKAKTSGQRIWAMFRMDSIAIHPPSVVIAPDNALHYVHCLLTCKANCEVAGRVGDRFWISVAYLMSPVQLFRDFRETVSARPEGAPPGTRNRLEIVIRHRETRAARGPISLRVTSATTWLATHGRVKSSGFRTVVRGTRGFPGSSVRSLRPERRLQTNHFLLG